MPADRLRDVAVAAIETSLAGSSRRPFVVGIAGPPAAGKSTLADAVCGRLGKVPERTVLALPMDGFHLHDDDLRERGLLAFKGREDTFDALGLVDLLGRVRAGLYGFHWPIFSRADEAVIPDGIWIGTVPDIVVVEGNYLLLGRGPWAVLRAMIDVAIFVDAPEAVLTARLLARHAEGGRSPEAARAKAEGTDLPNMRLIRTTACRADLVLDGLD